MAKIRIEWDAGHVEWELDPQELEEYKNQGSEIEYFDIHLSDAYAHVSMWPEVIE